MGLSLPKYFKCYKTTADERRRKSARESVYCDFQREFVERTSKRRKRHYHIDFVMIMDNEYQ